MVSVLELEVEQTLADCCLQSDTCHCGANPGILADLRGGLPDTVRGEKGDKEKFSRAVHA